jgi:methyl-accepting chemotaxis protein
VIGTHEPRLFNWRQGGTDYRAVVRASSEAAAAMAVQSAQANAAVQTMAAVSEEQSAGTEQVSAAMQQMSAQGAELAHTAEQMTALVARFTIAPADGEGAKVLPLRMAA